MNALYELALPLLPSLQSAILQVVRVAFVARASAAAAPATRLGVQMLCGAHSDLSILAPQSNTSHQQFIRPQTGGSIAAGRYSLDLIATPFIPSIPSTGAVRPAFQGRLCLRASRRPSKPHLY